jgi:hypothetical protein
VRSQAGKITELEMAYADLKCEKDNVTTGYRRLVVKHDAFLEKAEQEKTKLAEADMVELDKLRGDLDLETHSYMEHRQTMHRQLRELHEIVASSFDKVKVLPFPDNGMKVEEMID